MGACMDYRMDQGRLGLGRPDSEVSAPPPIGCCPTMLALAEDCAKPVAVPAVYISSQVTVQVDFPANPGQSEPVAFGDDSGLTIPCTGMGRSRSPLEIYGVVNMPRHGFAAGVSRNSRGFSVTNGQSLFHLGKGEGDAQEEMLRRVR
ncbi:hypothetical protein I7I51_05836, partial [Histoplasma capsulatum]